MAHRAQKRDGNERQIIEALQALGVWVDQLDGGNGRPDLACAETRNKSWFMLEIKVPGEGRLTPKQKKYHAECPGRIHLIETEAEAVAVAIRYMRPGGFNDGGTTL